jgi:hypothetical protein
VSRTSEAQRVWNFLGQTDAALAPLGFSPVRTGHLAPKVGVVLPLLDSVGTKMSQLEEVVGSRLEREGCILALVVAEHVMICFQNRDPHLSLEPVVRGPVEEPEDAANTGVEDASRIVAERFEQDPKDA